MGYHEYFNIHACFPVYMTAKKVYHKKQRYLEGGIPHMDYVGLGKRIRTQRKMMDMTQEELAAAIDVSTSFVGHIERGTRKLSVDTLVKLADALKTSCDQLLQDSLDQTVSRRNNNSMNKNAKMLLREIVNMLDEEE